MRGFLELGRMRVQAANAVAGLTWGWPSIGAFLGFVHALDRRLRSDAVENALFGDVAIISHHHQPLTVEHYQVHQFSISRNPLTRTGDTAPFNEEGKMHLEVTLLIELRDGFEEYLGRFAADLPADESAPQRWFAEQAGRVALDMRLAGGSIFGIGRRDVHFLDEGDDEDDDADPRRVLYRFLPGFALVDRSDLLARHFDALREVFPEIDKLTAWMDFGGLRYRSFVEEPDEADVEQVGVDRNGKSRVDWQRVPPPEAGWFVPLMRGYRAIGELAEPGGRPGARDRNVPFVPVESLYGVGQWIGPHRAPSVESLFWRHEFVAPDRYCFVNDFPAPEQPEENL